MTSRTVIAVPRRVQAQWQLARMSLMNFDFSEEAKLLREQARKFLREQCPPQVVRRVLEGPEPLDAPLWAAMGKLGWPGIAIPEEFGGTGLGYEGLCVLAEQVGQALAPVPFSSSVYLAAEAILRMASSSVRSPASSTL